METLDAKALKTLLAVVRFGSIRGAAEAMRVAPSVVSRQIADIERDVGLSLFERTTRGVVLTDAGTLVLEHGKRVVEDHSLLAEQLDQLRGLQQASVRISCGEGFMPDLVEHGLKEFASVYPAVKYDLTLGSTDGVLDAIANGDADIGIAYNPVIDTRMRSLAIARQPLCLIAPIGHPLLDRAKVSLAECLASPCAMLRKGHGVTQLVGRVAADNGLAIAPVVETASIDALRRFVNAGLGVTFLPKFAVSTELSRHALGVVELSDSAFSDASAHLIVRARRRLPTSVERLAGCLAKEMVAFQT